MDKSLEYSSLREEHHMNRKFVFERPLLIVGVALAAAYRISDGDNARGASSIFISFAFNSVVHVQ
jgi:hypothetical protein